MTPERRNPIYRPYALKAIAEMHNLPMGQVSESKPDDKRPFEWLRQESTQAFISFVSDSLNMGISHVINSKAGKGGGTWACWQLGASYALPNALHGGI